MSDDEVDDPSGGGLVGDESWQGDRLSSSRLSDIDAHRLLVRLGHSTHQLSARCWSTAAATALAAAAKALRLLASALYRANIRDDNDRTDLR